MSKSIEETKATCKACGKVWYYGKADAIKNLGDKMSNTGKDLTCCGGCLPRKNIQDLNKCPQCGSGAVEKEKITHEV